MTRRSEHRVEMECTACGSRAARVFVTEDGDRICRACLEILAGQVEREVRLRPRTEASARRSPTLDRSQSLEVLTFLRAIFTIVRAPIDQIGRMLGQAE